MQRSKSQGGGFIPYLRCRWRDSGNLTLIFNLGNIKDLISYKVLALEPFSIEECTAPTGAACGSVYLNQGFESLIRSRLGRDADSILNPRVSAEIISQFETIKRRFNPYEGGEDDYDVPLRGAPEMPHIGLEEGYLKLSK